MTEAGFPHGLFLQREQQHGTYDQRAAHPTNEGEILIPEPPAEERAHHRFQISQNGGLHRGKVAQGLPVPEIGYIGRHNAEHEKRACRRRRYPREFRKKRKHECCGKEGDGKKFLGGITVLVPGEKKELEGIGETGKQSTAYADIGHFPPEAPAGKTDQAGTCHGQRQSRHLHRVDSLVKEQTGKKGHPCRSREHENNGNGPAAFLDGNLKGQNNEGYVDRAEEHHAHKVASPGMKASAQYGVRKKAQPGYGHAPECHGGRIHAFRKAYAGNRADDSPCQRSQHAVGAPHPKTTVLHEHFHARFSTIPQTISRAPASFSKREDASASAFSTSQREEKE